MANTRRNRWTAREILKAEASVKAQHPSVRRRIESSLDQLPEALPNSDGPQSPTVTDANPQ